MPLLAGAHTVVAVDARGYGESDKPYAGYDGRTIRGDLLGI
jgi:pimeloyl-ACP methyl ester carboxylesterase